MAKDSRVLITGGTGLLGKAIIESSGKEFEIAGAYVGDYEMKDSGKVKYYKADIRDDASVNHIFADFKPDVVVHAASIGSPDFAEKFKELTWDINVEGTKRMISCCEKAGSKFIFISSNGIYDGDKAPYSEEDKASPVNYYGETKLEGERLSRSAGVPTSIVRPILMYGWNHSFERSNIVTIAMQKMLKNEKIFAYDDVYSNPLYSGSCGEAIWKIIADGKYEDFNISGSERCSIYELLVKTAEVFGCDGALVSPVKQGYFNELVKRPVDTSYRTNKMKNVLKVKPLSINEGLSIMRSADPRKEH